MSGIFGKIEMTAGGRFSAEFGLMRCPQILFNNCQAWWSAKLLYWDLHIVRDLFGQKL